MSRPVVLSNGSLHVGLNMYAEVHDFYFPYIGQENHAAAKSMRHRIGIWVDHQFSWLDDSSWEFSYNYHGYSLIGHIRAVNHNLNVQLEFDDTVDAKLDTFLRNIHVINDHPSKREIKLFMHQVFDIGDWAGNGDTVQFLPDSNAVLHYRGNRMFVVSGQHAASQQSFDQYSMGLFGLEGHKGTYADAEDGILEGNNVEHGRVDSVLGFTLEIEPHLSARVHYWIACGTTQREALDVHETIQQKTNVVSRLIQTKRWWDEWLQPARKAADNLDKEWQDSFLKNILLIKSHIDNNGAVIASTDTTRLNFSRDAYAYCWPRDGAYTVWPLIRLGYTKEPLAFFDFCKKVLHKNGYLMHKFLSDGSLGSSWHPYVHGNETSAPIQEDETAIVLFVFAQYYKIHKSPTLLEEYYEQLVAPMANFLSGYIHEATGLLKPSYDLWERIYSTTTYTTAVTYASLLAAAEIAEVKNDQKSAVRWRTAANDIKDAAEKYLYSPTGKHLYRGVTIKDTTVESDQVVDISAFFGAFMYGLFNLEGDVIKNSAQKVLENLSVDVGDFHAVARFTDDEYFRISDSLPGNPWFVTTLWMAQYYLEINDREKAVTILRWSKDSMLDTGVLPEQINPYNKSYVSVAPLTWSQAEYVSTLLDLMGD